ncbi:MAG TPA: lysozyme inhibitor LprI family protein [Pyrinomonadaceae bacterium]|nr:lysozyme inhibitor LprI family protein [Pyrinomonadaceae bacterium]
MNKLRGGLLLLLLFCAPATTTTTLAQDEAAAEEHAIDKALGRCIDKDPSTAGMVNCISQAAQDWDRELNRNYKRLSEALDPAPRRALKTAQQEWLKYRDREFALIDALYAKMEGTMYIPMHAEDRLRVVKRRALELAAYLNFIENP